MFLFDLVSRGHRSGGHLVHRCFVGLRAYSLVFRIRHVGWSASEGRMLGGC